jgi:hypothetical protein
VIWYVVACSGTVIAESVLESRDKIEGTFLEVDSQCSLS